MFCVAINNLSDNYVKLAYGLFLIFNARKYSSQTQSWPQQLTRNFVTLKSVVIVKNDYTLDATS